MINNITILQDTSSTGVLNDNSADVRVGSNGMLNVAGFGQIPVQGIQPNIEKVPSQAQQIQKSRIVIGANPPNNSNFTVQISGFDLTSGEPRVETANFLSGNANTVALTAAGIAAAVNALSNFSVSADGVTDTTLVDFLGKSWSTYPNCYNAPVFTITSSVNGTAEATFLPISAPLTVTFGAAPTGGVTAQGYVLVPDNGTLSTVANACVIITNPGEGYLVAPTLTFAGGEGASAAAVCYLFQGRVVGTKASAGSSYDTREGKVELGTYNQLRKEFNYPGTGNVTPDYPILSTLVSGRTYTKWTINYNLAPIGGQTTISSPTQTMQLTILVYESATNVGLVNAWYGSLQNLQYGYRVTISDSGTSNTAAITVATGVLVIAVGGTPAYGTVALGIKPGDIIVCGTPVTPNTDGNVAANVVTITTNTDGFVQYSGTTLSTNSAAAVYKLISRQPLTV